MMGRLKMKTHRSRKKISKSKILGMPDVREHSQAISEFGLKKGGKKRWKKFWADVDRGRSRSTTE
jgi:hypothetical protein